jgi:hypothetical protein
LTLTRGKVETTALETDYPKLMAFSGRDELPHVFTRGKPLRYMARVGDGDVLNISK